VQVESCILSVFQHYYMNMRIISALF